jgi:hypothetical protein
MLALDQCQPNSDRRCLLRYRQTALTGGDHAAEVPGRPLSSIVGVVEAR